MYPYKLSVWRNAKATKASQRIDIAIHSFSNLAAMFGSINPVENKIDQKILTRCWQHSRARDNEHFEPPYIVTLDYDSVTIDISEVEHKLLELKINFLIFTTWSHKTIVTPQKKNNGKNCFKVVLEVTAKDKEELNDLTIGLAHLVGKKDLKTVDDFSAGIFIQGCHPDFEAEAKSIAYTLSKYSIEYQKEILVKACKEAKELEPEISKDPLDDFEAWDKTVGQKWTPERIKRALATIKYEEVEGFSKMSIWYSIGYALHSTGDSDLFELWDEWCLENCAEHGVYNREENEKFWAKQTVPKDKQNLCTLSTLWHLEKLFKNKKETSEIRQSSWNFFDTLAKETPEPVSFLIEGLLVEKSIGFLVGTGGVGKSSLCLEIAKAISSGQPLFNVEGYETKKKTVAVINKEDSLNKIHNQIHNLISFDLERLHRGALQDFAEYDESELVGNTDEDLKKIKDQWENVARPLWAQSNIRLTNIEGEDLESLGAVIGSLKALKQELIEQKKPELGLVIFDPMNLWHGGDQNSQRDMGFIFSAFQQIQRELDTAVLIVHHMNKSNGYSGSHTLRDSGRFMWYLRPTMIGKDPSDKYIDFYVEKNNDAKANFTALNFIRTEKGLLDQVPLNLSEEKK